MSERAAEKAEINELNYWYTYGLDGTAEQAAAMAMASDMDGATALITADVLRMVYCDPNFKQSGHYDDDNFRRALTMFTAGRMFEIADRNKEQAPQF